MSWLHAFRSFKRRVARHRSAAVAGSPAVHRRLADALAGMQDVQSREHAALAALLERLLGEAGKAGREQFRTTTLLDGQSATLEELAESVRAAAHMREQELAELRRRSAEWEGQARLGLVKDLLPVADALDASIRTARALLAELRAATPHRPSLLARLRGGGGAPATRDDSAAALDGWLDGLLLIERRLLALLDREGVQPIAAIGRAFDPHRHRAVAAVPAAGAGEGTVVGEELRGYMLGERVLRYAEVTVARGVGGTAHAPTTDGA